MCCILCSLIAWPQPPISHHNHLESHPSYADAVCTIVLKRPKTLSLLVLDSGISKMFTPLPLLGYRIPSSRMCLSHHDKRLLQCSQSEKLFFIDFDIPSE